MCGPPLGVHADPVTDGVCLATARKPECPEGRVDAHVIAINRVVVESSILSVKASGPHPREWACWAVFGGLLHSERLFGAGNLCDFARLIAGHSPPGTLAHECASVPGAVERVLLGCYLFGGPDIRRDAVRLRKETDEQNSPEPEGYRMGRLI